MLQRINKSAALQFLLLILLPVWFVLFGVNQHFGLVSFRQAAASTIKYILLFSFVSLAVWLIYRKKTGWFSLAVVVFLIYFFFGQLHDSLQHFLPAVSAYKILLPLLSILLIFFAVVVNRDKPWLKKLNEYFILLILVFFVIEAGKLIFNIANSNEKKNLLSVSVPRLISEKCDKNKPDIYFIVLDEYASSESLKEDLGFDNSSLDSLLKAAGFFVVNKSQANYNVTPFSLASTFDLTYLDPSIGSPRSSSKQFMQAIYTLKHNHIVPFLEKQGYSISNYGCFDFADHPAQVKTYFADYERKQVEGSTLSERFTNDVGWRFTTRSLFSKKFTIPSKYRKAKELHFYRNRFNAEQLIRQLQITADSPRFVYVHLMLPHEPFYYNEDGSPTSDSLVINNKQDIKQAYLAQVKYVNSILSKIISLANNKTGKEKVIIIEGDHGYKFFPEPLNYRKEFSNLNAFYFSDGNYRGLYESMSPVNSFRFILNKYFCQRLPLLKDTTVYVHNQ